MIVGWIFLVFFPMFIYSFVNTGFIPISEETFIGAWLGSLLGVITGHDVLSVLAPKRLPSYVFGMPDTKSFQHGTAETAEDVMFSKPVTCTPDDKIVDALSKMIRHKVKRLPVIKNKKIIGELTLHQLIRKYYAATKYHPIVEEG